MLEKGNDVIFSVVTVSTEKSDAHVPDFFGPASRRQDKRLQAIETLLAVSLIMPAADVRPDGRILLPVTRETKDGDRRVAAARRIRDGEMRRDLEVQIMSCRER